MRPFLSEFNAIFSVDSKMQRSVVTLTLVEGERETQCSFLYLTDKEHLVNFANISGSLSKKENRQSI